MKPTNKSFKFSMVIAFVLGLTLTGCEKEEVTPENYMPKSQIQANGPSRIDQTPVRLNVRHDIAKNSIQNIR